MYNQNEVFDHLLEILFEKHDYQQLFLMTGEANELPYDYFEFFLFFRYQLLIYNFCQIANLSEAFQCNEHKFY